MARPDRVYMDRTRHNSNSSSLHSMGRTNLILLRGLFILISSSLLLTLLFNRRLACSTLCSSSSSSSSSFISSSQHSNTALDDQEALPSFWVGVANSTARSARATSAGKASGTERAAEEEVVRLRERLREAEDLVEKLTALVRKNININTHTKKERLLQVEEGDASHNAAGVPLHAAGGGGGGDTEGEEGSYGEGTGSRINTINPMYTMSAGDAHVSNAEATNHQISSEASSEHRLVQRATAFLQGSPLPESHFLGQLWGYRPVLPSFKFPSSSLSFPSSALSAIPKWSFIARSIAARAADLPAESLPGEGGPGTSGAVREPGTSGGSGAVGDPSTGPQELGLTDDSTTSSLVNGAAGGTGSKEEQGTTLASSGLGVNATLVEAILELWENSGLLGAASSHAGKQNGFTLQGEFSGKQNGGSLEGEFSEGGSSEGGMPWAPHLDDCKAQSAQVLALDERGQNGTRPLWSMWGARFAHDLISAKDSISSDPSLASASEFARHAAEGPSGYFDDSEELLGTSTGPILGPFPPWVSGADEDNLILTRRVQRDIWLHQHPLDCSAPHVKFLVADIHIPRGAWFGVGAELNMMAGILSRALKLGRVLVLRTHDRANHNNCPEGVRNKWSCYFAPETSPACRRRALRMLKGTRKRRGVGDQVILLEERKRWPLLWEPAPRIWGSPWKYVNPTIQVGMEELIGITRDDSHRWFESQAYRYLMRYPSQHLCSLLNRARHDAFGRRTAELVAASLPSGWTGPQAGDGDVGPIAALWRSKQREHRGLVCMHVRQGDKKKEMKIVPFSEYMHLLDSTVRAQFPHASHLWLSTEMEAVIEEAESYKNWAVFNTKVPRQKPGASMKEYEAQLGKGKSMDNAFVNLLICIESEFFVGTMGSTWSVVIDGLRRTSGKEGHGLISVNRHRYWSNPPS